MDTTPDQRTYRGPQGLGEDAAAYIGTSDGAGEGLRGVPPDDGRQQALLRQWAETGGHLIAESDWAAHKIVSQATSEHDVRFRAADDRAVKRTWPGTFGFIPRLIDGKWALRSATPLEYLARLRWQNEIFGDDLRVEGVMISEGPSFIIGQPAGGISLVISQPWLKAADLQSPHPTETEIAAVMRAQGFEPLIGAFFGWRRASDGIVVTDARPDNFIKTALGVMAIDLHITQLPEITPASA